MDSNRRLVSRFFFSILLFIAVCPISLFANEKISEHQLDEVTVWAKKLYQDSLVIPTYEYALNKLKLTPGAFSIVNDEDSHTRTAAHMEDLLSDLPGVFAKSRFGSEDVKLSIRGSGVQSNFQTRGVKLLQDGVPINLADGFGDFNAIEPLAMSYAEVYRGANALRYGATTLGGAIHFVSKTGYDAPKAQARFEVGSFNTIRSQISSGYVLGPMDYYISLSQTYRDGFRNHSDQNTKRMFFNVGWRHSEELESRLFLTLVDSKSKLPGTLTKAQLRANPKQPQSIRVARNEKRNFDLIRGAYKSTYHKGVHRLESAFFWTYKDLDNPVFRVNNQISHDFGLSLHYENSEELLGRPNLFTFGLTPVFGTKNDDRFSNVGGEAFRRLAESLKISSNIDIYAEDQIAIVEDLYLIGGLQYSFASREQKDRFFVDGDHSGHPTYHGWSPKVGLRYDYKRDLQVFVNFNHSFEPPSFLELTNAGSGGLTDLNEQTAETIEVGFRTDRSNLNFEAAYYFSWVDDELLSLTDSQGNALGTVNADDTTHQGLELGSQWNFFGPFHLNFAYAWTHLRFDDDAVFSSNALPSIPEHFLKSELLYKHEKGFYAGVDLEWSMKKYPVDMANTLFAEAYAIMGLKAGYKTQKGWSLFVQAKNLTNEKYTAATNSIANAGGRDLAQFFPGEGRSWTGGIEFQW